MALLIAGRKVDSTPSIDCGVAAHSHDAAVTSPKHSRTLSQRVHRAQHRAGIREQLLPVSREDEPAPNAVEQPDPEVSSSSLIWRDSAG